MVPVKVPKELTLEAVPMTNGSWTANSSHIGRGHGGWLPPAGPFLVSLFLSCRLACYEDIAHFKLGGVYIVYIVSLNYVFHFSAKFFKFCPLDTPFLLNLFCNGKDMCSG